MADSIVYLRTRDGRVCTAVEARLRLEFPDLSDEERRAIQGPQQDVTVAIAGLLSRQPRSALIEAVENILINSGSNYIAQLDTEALVDSLASPDPFEVGR